MAKVSKPPACLDAERCPTIAACLDANPCCVAFGSIGSDKPLGISRNRLMTGVLFAAGLALCLNVFACLAMSTVGGVIRTSAWAVGRARRGPGTAYFGLTSAVAYHDDKIIYEESLGARRMLRVRASARRRRAGEAPRRRPEMSQLPPPRRGHSVYRHRLHDHDAGHCSFRDEAHVARE